MAIVVVEILHKRTSKKRMHYVTIHASGLEFPSPIIIIIIHTYYTIYNLRHLRVTQNQDRYCGEKR